MNGIITIKMTADEARQCANEIKAGINDVGKRLLQLYEGEGWKVLGYDTWRECAQIEFGFKKTHVYQLLEFAEVTRNIEFSAIAENLMLPQTESVARPLTRLEPEEQPIVWQRAVDSAPNGKITAAHVQSVKDEYEKAKRITEPSDYDFSDDATDYDWTEDEESPEQAYIEPEEVATVSKPHVSNNSGNNEWYTPSEYVEAARKVLGVIELDPASSPEANQVVKAKVYYTVNDDGLQFDWHGKVWMNPPYASGLIDRFATKIVFHYENKDITEAIILVNNATETGWFNEIINASSAAIFPKSRVRFWKPDGELGAPLQGQAIMYLGANKESFLREFSKFGWGAEIVIPR